MQGLMEIIFGSIQGYITKIVLDNQVNIKKYEYSDLIFFFRKPFLIKTMAHQ